MGVILDENGDTTQRSYWSSLLQMRTRILDEGKHLRLAYDKALEKPLFEKGHYFEGADTNDPADMKKRNASYKLDYALHLVVLISQAPLKFDIGIGCIAFFVFHFNTVLFLNTLAFSIRIIWSRE